MQHVEPARDLIASGETEALGYPRRQLAVAITLPPNLFPINFLDLEHLFARKLRRGRLGVLRSRPFVNNVPHLVQRNAYRLGNPATPSGWRTLGSLDVAFVHFDDPLF